VLIAAAFCMYNRYVDGLATWQPRERDAVGLSSPLIGRLIDRVGPRRVILPCMTVFKALRIARVRRIWLS
jgi:hypothetical protein